MPMNQIPPDALKAGDVVARRYIILRHLRDESCGGVWLAQDRSLGVDVSLKFLPRRFSGFEAGREALRREGALALKLRHPNILQVIHFEEGDEGAYLIQEPFAGETLLARLNRLERFRLPEALDLLEQVAQALALAHQHHEVHQSLDPSHVLLDDHTAKLINFSCPGHQEEEPQVTRLELKAYLAPEILQGEPVTPAANVFSLGVLGFRLAAGSLPYSLTFDEPLPYRLEDMPADLGEIPLPLQNLLLQCLAPDPHDRFEDSGAFLFALEQRRESWRTPSSVKWLGWTSDRPSQAAGVMASISRAWDRVRQGSKGTTEKLTEGLKDMKEKGEPSLARRLLIILTGVVLVMVALVWAGRTLLWKAEAPPTPAPATIERPAAPAVPQPAFTGKLPPAGGPPLKADAEPGSPPRPAGTSSQLAATSPKTVKPTPAAPKEAYQVLVATYRTYEEAKALKNKIKAKHLPAQVVRVTSGKKTYFVVKSGPFPGKNQADQAAQRLKTQERLAAAPKVVKLPAAAPKTPAPKPRR
jgi:eukaryotic-like serine/threonine-protein kinase